MNVLIILCYCTNILENYALLYNHYKLLNEAICPFKSVKWPRWPKSELVPTYDKRPGRGHSRATCTPDCKCLRENFFGLVLSTCIDVNKLGISRTMSQHLRLGSMFSGMLEWVEMLKQFSTMAGNFPIMAFEEKILDWRKKLPKTLLKTLPS